MNLRVAIRADASVQMGDGHVMRCLTLADEVRRRGGAVLLIAASIPDRLAQSAELAGHSVTTLPSRDRDAGACEGSDWDRFTWSRERQLADASMTRASAVAHGANFLLVDHYQLDATFEEAVGLPVIALDDLANRTHRCSLLIDHNLGREPSDYTGLLAVGTPTLTGPRYAALRPAFAALRPIALERRKAGGPPRRLLISLGSTDVGGLTSCALEAALGVFATIPIDVIIRPNAPSRPQVDAIAANVPTVRVHDQAPDMAAMMMSADLAIGAGGTSSWERCALGLPSICLAVAHNQKFVAEELAGAGVSAYAGEVADIEPMLRSLAGDAARLARMSAAAFAITDGGGAARIVDHLVGQTAGDLRSCLVLRAAAAADSEALWLWRNDPVMRSMAKSSAPIAWTDHRRWFEGILSASNVITMVGEVDGNAVGMVRFDAQERGFLVSINVAPDARGRGLGAKLLADAILALERRVGPKPLIAEIRRENPASIRVFEANGFKATPSPENGFVQFLR